MSEQELTPEIYTDLYADLTRLIQDIQEHTANFDPLYGGAEARLAVMKMNQAKTLFHMALVEIGAVPAQPQGAQV